MSKPTEMGFYWARHISGAGQWEVICVASMGFEKEILRRTGCEPYHESLDCFEWGPKVERFPDHPSVSASASQLVTPCCGQPMVPIDGGNAGRPCVMFNPDNEVVQCHRCGTVWEPSADEAEPDEDIYAYTCPKHGKSYSPNCMACGREAMGIESDEHD